MEANHVTARLFNYLKLKYEENRASAEKKRAAKAEKSRNDHLNYITARLDDKYKYLIANKNMISDEFINEFKSTYESHISIEEKFNFFKRFDQEKLDSLVNSLKTIISEDSNFDNINLSSFECKSSDLLFNMDRQIRDQIIESAIREYSVSASGNSIATAAALLNRNYASAAQSIASGIKAKGDAGHHNGSIHRLFNQDIYRIRFTTPAIEMDNTTRYFARTAWRLSKVGVGDQNIVSKALFSLIYNNKYCKALPPSEADSYSRASVGEFANRFGGYAWSPREAAAQIEEIVRTSSTAAQIAKTSKLNFSILNTNLEYNLITQ